MAQDLLGRTFNGRYRLIEKIGTGGMAEVYRAEDMVLGRIVALKVMLPQYAADEEFTSRFRQEAASAANLQNPYIVNIYDWGKDADDYFIVMEYVKGSDLKSGIKQRGALSQRKAAQIGMQVCQALTTAHSQDIIHRDIKPQNIMVQPDGNVKVMDFGIASAKNSVKTQTSSVLGTAHYISPEQAQGKDLTPATDIYSLGVVLYETVTGQVPFDGPDAVSVAMKQVNETPQAPRAINPSIEPDLELIIGMAMNKNPRQRFATARDMQNALSDFLNGRPVNLNGSESQSDAAKTAVIAGAAGVGGVAAGAALGAAAAHASESDAAKTGVMSPDAVNQRSAQNRNFKSGQAKGSKPKMNPKKKKIIIGAVIGGIVAVGVVLFLLFGLGQPVPDVVGKNIEEAKTIITDAGFEVGTIDKTYSKEFKADQVVSQDPNSLFKKPKGTKINLVISMGTEQANVPDVRGKSASEAQDILQKAGFEVAFGEETYSKEYGAGKIASQDPAPGTKADKGGKVTICISKGTQEITVPNVVNYSEASAISTLKDAGFSVNVQREYSDSVDEGNVMSQSPSGGKMEKGSTVTIVVSRGSDKVNVPSVVGMTVDQARSTLSAAGLNVVVNGTGKTVLSQNPSSGKVSPGSTITLNT